VKKQLGIEGAWLYTPEIRADTRGSFTEVFAASDVPGMRVAQAACSISYSGVIRGIHVSDVPPGRAKYVTCPDGKIMDVAVDLRTGSPTFGQWEGAELTSSNQQAMYLAPGLGHAFMVLSQRAVVMYLHSTAHDPATDQAISALDLALGIRWPLGLGQVPVMSDRDMAAPTLARALEAGLLPSYKDCQALETSHAV
jgi:dTDP-4-dehydrorhamnose 3,5-epimerase